tara:strand:+ start:41 stop:481 length:441 start_codon:yes stop_codon:yes gene_type:complete
MATLALTPRNVTLAITNPTFHQNHPQFWKMLCYLFTEHEQKKVWQHIDKDTFRTIMEQVHVVMENTDQYRLLRSNQQLLYHVYMAALTSIKASRSVAQFQGHERYSVLQAFHYLYKQLFAMNVVMPLFCHVAEDFVVSQQSITIKN